MIERLVARETILISRSGKKDDWEIHSVWQVRFEVLSTLEATSSQKKTIAVIRYSIDPLIHNCPDGPATSLLMFLEVEEAQMEFLPFDDIENIIPCGTEALMRPELRWS